MLTPEIWHEYLTPDFQVSRHGYFHPRRTILCQHHSTLGWSVFEVLFTSNPNSCISVGTIDRSGRQIVRRGYSNCSAYPLKKRVNFRFSGIRTISFRARLIRALPTRQARPAPPKVPLSHRNKQLGRRLCRCRMDIQGLWFHKPSFDLGQVLSAGRYCL
jgi:hypothetical protein